VLNRGFFGCLEWRGDWMLELVLNRGVLGVGIEGIMLYRGD
jgi:hypothetical protein